MEIAPKPQLDWYVGRPVTDVTKYGDDPHEWQIEFVGGAVVKNENPSAYPKPDHLVGTSLLTVILSELDTRLKFDNNIEIRLVPTRYTIVDPEFGESRSQWPDELPEPEALVQYDKEHGLEDEVIPHPVEDDEE